MQRVYLVYGKCRSRVGHHILDAALVHGDNVGVAFDHIDTVLLGDGLLGLIDAVELVVLMVDLAVGRVDILLLHSLRGRVELSPAEAHHLSAHAYPGEDDATGVAVDEVAAVGLVADACLQQELLLVAFLHGGTGQCARVGQVEAQLKLLDDVVAETARAEILQADGHAVGMVAQRVLKIAEGPLVDDEHRLALRLLAPLLIGQLTLLYLDMVFVGQPAQRLGIGHLLVLHDEADGRAALAAPEAVARATRGRDKERRGLLVVERAQSLVVRPCLAQRDELRHHVNNIGRVLDAFYGLAIYHSSLAKLAKNSEKTTMKTQKIVLRHPEACLSQSNIIYITR